MTVIKRFVLGAMLGLFTGTIGLVLACTICLIVAFQTGGDAALPGVFEASFVTVDGLPELRFLPNPAGMGVALAVWSVACGILGAGLRRRRPRPGDDRPVVGRA